MIIENSANTAALAGRISPNATEADARTALDNLLESGWDGWDSVDLPDGLINYALKGLVESPKKE